MKRWISIALAIFRCLAQEPIRQAEPTVITVSAEAMPLSASSASVTVLTRDVIEQSRTDNVGDLLRQAPFLFLTQSGARGGLTTVTLRGGKPNFTLVMIDGIPVNDISDTLGGAFDFSTLSSDNVERIEIVRGPLSSVYGSEAVDGVINIISRTGQGAPTLEAGAFLGNFATREAHLGSSGNIGRFDYALSGSYLSIGEQVENDRFRLGSLAFHSHAAFDADKSLEAVIHFENSAASGFPPNGGGPDFSILRDPEHVQVSQVAAGLTFRQQATPRWLYTLSFDVFNREQDLQAPAILDALPPTFRSIPSELEQTSFRRYRLGLSNAVVISSRLTAHVAIGGRQEDGSSNGLLAARIPDRFELRRSTLGVSGELVYRSDRLTASLGVRSDKSGGFANVWSPRAGVSYRLTRNGPRIRASWGRGFKLPSFFALADPNVGNRLLKPEHGASFDVGVAGGVGRRLSLELTAFHNHYRDLVDFSAQAFRLVNRSEARTEGLEFGSTLAVAESLTLGAHLSYLAWDVKPSFEPLRDVPHWRGGLNLIWKPARRWDARADALWVSRRFDFQVPVASQPTVGGYTTANLATSYELGRGVTAFVRLDNILDHHFHEFIGFPNPGISARLGFSYHAFGHPRP